VVALRIYDERETRLPNVGLIKLKDAETGVYTWIDTSDEKARNTYRVWWKRLSAQLDNSFKKSGVDYVEINTSQDYVKSLISLFKKRA